MPADRPGTSRYIRGTDHPAAQKTLLPIYTQSRLSYHNVTGKEIIFNYCGLLGVHKLPKSTPVLKKAPRKTDVYYLGHLNMVCNDGKLEANVEEEINN